MQKIHAATDTFTIGKASLLHDGDDIAIITNGVLAARALTAAKQLLERGIHARRIEHEQH